MPVCRKQAGYASCDRHGYADETSMRRLGRSEAQVERGQAQPETPICSFYLPNRCTLCCHEGAVG
jgi:hypothetical protein